MTRYRSHEWVPIAGVSTGTYTTGPLKFVIHTTEGGLAGALAAYANKRVVPHFTWDRASRRRLQHVDTKYSVSALANDTGGVQTNRDGAIQVEITGFAGESHLWSDADLRWIAEGIREVCEAEGIDYRRFKRFVGTEAGTIATETAPQRMSPAEWDSWNGVCGHQHVPENHHWDPGRLNYPRILEFIVEEDDPLAAFTPESLTLLMVHAVGVALEGPARPTAKTLIQGAVLDGIRERTDDHPERGVLRDPFKALIREVMNEETTA